MKLPGNSIHSAIDRRQRPSAAIMRLVLSSCAAVAVNRAAFVLYDHRSETSSEDVDGSRAAATAQRRGHRELRSSAQLIVGAARSD